MLGKWADRCRAGDIDDFCVGRTLRAARREDAINKNASAVLAARSSLRSLFFFVIFVVQIKTPRLISKRWRFRLSQVKGAGLNDKAALRPHQTAGA